MIRYAATLEELQARVEQDVPGWGARANRRTEKFRCKKKYDEKSSIWSEVKPVFMELQGEGKCCFCERKFESGELGRHELDIEHFRPKGNVKECPQSRVGEGIHMTAPPGANDGYYLLAYHLLNYAAACKPCNSGLKKDYFPNWRHAEFRVVVAVRDLFVHERAVHGEIRFFSVLLHLKHHPAVPICHVSSSFAAPCNAACQFRQCA